MRAGQRKLHYNSLDSPPPQVRPVSQAAPGDEGQLDARHVSRPAHQHALLHDKEQGAHPVLLPLQLRGPSQDGQQLQHDRHGPGERADETDPGRKYSGGGYEDEWISDD